MLVPWFWLLVAGAAPNAPIAERAEVDVEVVGRWATVRTHQRWILDAEPEGGVVYLLDKPWGSEITEISMEIGPTAVRSRVVVPEGALEQYKSGLEQGRRSGLTIRNGERDLQVEIADPPVGEPLEISVQWTVRATSRSGQQRLVVPIRSVGHLLAREDWLGRYLESDGTQGPLYDRSGAPLPAEVEVHLVGPGPVDRVSIDGPLTPMRVGATTVLKGTVPGRRDLVLRWESSPNQPTFGAVRQGNATALWLEAPDSVPRRQVVGRHLVFSVDGPASSAYRLITQRALLDAIVRIDDRDTVRVAGATGALGRRQLATPEVVHALKQWVRDLAPTNGGAVLASDETGVFFVGGADTTWLDRIGSDRSAYVFRSVAGEDPELDHTAVRFTSVRPDEDPRAAVRRYVDQLSKPVLTDLHATADRDYRVPDLGLKGPVFLLVPRSPTVSLRGATRDGPWTRTLQPVELEGRTLIVHRAIELAGESAGPEVTQAGLEAQVPLPGTTLALVGQDAEAQETWTVERDLRIEGLGQAIREAVDKRRVIQTLQVASGSGRAYQSSISLAPGVMTNRNTGGGASNENSYMLDGANITDPVTGAFSVNFNFDALSQVRVFLDGYMPRYQGARGDVIDAQLASGTNTLEASAGVSHTQRTTGSVGSDTVAASVGGPILRDHLWSLGGMTFDRSDDPDRSLQRLSVSEHLAWQPKPEHRLTAFGAWAPTELRTGGRAFDLQGALGQVAWQWTPSPDLDSRTTATATDSSIGPDHRSRQHLQSRVSFHSVQLAGEHEPELGFDVERIAWQPAGVLARAWPGDTSQPIEAVRIGVYAQDRYEVRPWLELAGGARADRPYDTVLLSPRAYAAIDPGSDDKTVLHAGFGRSWSPLHVTDPLHPDGPQSTLKDEWLASVRHEPIRDLGVQLTGRHQHFDGLLGTDLTAQPLALLVGTASIDKRYRKRWSTDLSYTRTHVLVPPQGALFGVSTLGRFRDRIQAVAVWSLPTDPWTVEVSCRFTLDANPLLPAAPDPATLQVPAPAQRAVDVGLAQSIPAAKGALEVSARYQNTTFLEAVPTPELLLNTDPIPDLPAWEGHRIQVGVDYSF